MSEPTPLSAEHVSPETWKLLQNAFPAYQDEQLDFVIGLERFQRSALTKLAHWVNPDPECDHCYAAWAQWASEGDGPFTFAQIAYWNTSEVTSGFERRLLATIDAQATEIAALRGALERLLPLTEEFEYTLYGNFMGGDPREFSPDEEMCTPEEISAWETACEEWNRGEGVDRGPGCQTMGDGSAVTGTGFGLGTTIRKCAEREEAKRVLAGREAQG